MIERTLLPAIQPAIHSASTDTDRCYVVEDNMSVPVCPYIHKSLRRHRMHTGILMSVRSESHHHALHALHCIAFVF